MSRKISIKTAFIVALITGVTTALAAWAATEFRRDYFVATYYSPNLTPIQDLWDDTYLSEDALHFTHAVNRIRMADGADAIWMAMGDDEVNLGPGSDFLRFLARDSDVEKIEFDETLEASIEWDNGNDELLIKNESGNIIIQLGQ